MESTVNYWKISPGAAGDDWESQLKQGAIGIHFFDLGDLTTFSEDESRKKIREAYGSELTPAKQANTFGQMREFMKIKEGDIIIANSGKSKILGVGRVAGPYKYRPELRHPHTFPVDWLRTFYKIAQENGRKLVVKMNDAYFLKYLSKDAHLDVPDIDDEHIIIYLPKRGGGTYSDSDYKGSDKQFLDLHNAWTAEQIASKESKVLCAIGFYSFTALIDMKPKSGAVYIHSSSEPYTEEQVLSEDRVDAWIKHFDMNKFQSHCSGHARGRDLLEAVSEISAKRLFPIHTKFPEMFKKVAKDLTEVKEGVTYNL